MAVSPLLHLYTLTQFALSFLVANFIHLSAKVKLIKTHNYKLSQNIFFLLQSSSSSQGVLLVTTAYCLWGLTNIGLLYDKSGLAWPGELLRCLATLLMFPTIGPVYTAMVSGPIVYNVFTASALVSMAMVVRSTTGKTKDKDL